MPEGISTTTRCKTTEKLAFFKCNSQQSPKILRKKLKELKTLLCKKKKDPRSTIVLPQWDLHYGRYYLRAANSASRRRGSCKNLKQMKHIRDEEKKLFEETLWLCTEIRNGSGENATQTLP